MTDGDVIRRAAMIMSDLLSSTLLYQPIRERDMRRAYLDGDDGGLYIWEREAVDWLAQRPKDNCPINDWTASLVQRLRP